MKKALKIVLIYFLLLQVVAPIIAIPYALIINLINGEVLTDNLNSFLIPGMVIGMGAMMLYHWRADYLKKLKVDKSVVTPQYILLSILMLMSCSWLISVLMSKMTWIPNIMEQTFDQILSNWFGIIIVAVLGPIVEEYVFRGAITRVLLEKYTPTKAILISAAIFGIFHINPAQVLPAFLIGIVLAWVYYRTASLIPVMLMHIVNNSFSVWVMRTYPDVDEINELIAPSAQIIVSIVAVAVFFGAYLIMKKVRANYNWKKDQVEPIVIVNENE